VQERAVAIAVTDHRHTARDSVQAMLQPDASVRADQLHLPNSLVSDNMLEDISLNQAKALTRGESIYQYSDFCCSYVDSIPSSALKSRQQVSIACHCF